MFFLACGGCGLSLLSINFPPYHSWLALLPVALLSAFVIQKLEGKLTGSKVIEVLIAVFVGTILAAVMLAAIIIPLVFLGSLLYFLVKLFSKNKPSRVIAAIMLILFVGTGFYSHQEAQSYGKAWKLTRHRTGTPGRALIDNFAKDKTFSPAELLEMSKSPEPGIAKGAIEILLQSARYQTDLAEATEVAEVLKKAGNQLDVDTFWANVPEELSEQMNAEK